MNQSKLEVIRPRREFDKRRDVERRLPEQLSEKAKWSDEDGIRTHEPYVQSVVTVWLFMMKSRAATKRTNPAFNSVFGNLCGGIDLSK